MNLDNIKKRLAAKSQIRDASQSIRKAKTEMKKYELPPAKPGSARAKIEAMKARKAAENAAPTPRSRSTQNPPDIIGGGGIRYTGFTDPEERKILEKGGNLFDIEEHRQARAKAITPPAPTPAKAARTAAPASSATKPAPAASKPVTAASTAGNRAFVPTTIPTMSKAAFDGLSPADKMRFSVQGGKIVVTGNGAFVPNPAPTLSKTEFDKLSPRDKSRFSVQGGKIVEPETAKPHRDAKGTLTRAGLAAMSPADRTAHFKAGGKLAD